MRDALFAFALGVAAALVAYGAWMAYRPAGLIVGGLLLAGWSWLILSEAEAS